LDRQTGKTPWSRPRVAHPLTLMLMLDTLSLVSFVLPAKVAEALWRGGIERANNPNGNTPGMKGAGDVALIYAGQVMDHGKKLQDYNVPPGCKVMIAIEKAKLKPGAKPDPDSAYWN